ncbi:hypothetical protein [Nostoc sp.]|uniref:hypothetical protein n=1 Tax=Nostoc sp. TaxID=1180 RepID=UPI002FF78D99
MNAVCLFAGLVSWILRQDKVRQFLKELPTVAAQNFNVSGIDIKGAKLLTLLKNYIEAVTKSNLPTYIYA